VSFAKVVVSGEITSEPEKRFTPNNHPVTTFNLNVENPMVGSRPAEPFTVRVTCWRNLADAAANQLQKGQYILVEGKLILNSYQTQDGVQKKAFEVEASSLDKLPGAPEAVVPVAASQTTDNADSIGGSKPYGSNDAYPASSASSVNANTGGSYANAGMSKGSSSQNSGHFSSEDLLSEDDIPF
jgi:single-strand DNA-binding protein